MVHRHAGKVIAINNTQAGWVPEHSIAIIAQCSKSVAHGYRAYANPEFKECITGCARINELA
ncbi:hypothetical protein A2Y85_01380 [candidate division WOR-3 bacterium RBG_13_43_14]|uniref:Uncharacterized protein n=1 Tax=candidate division WOR-3 bacterium RBG_13_43_14 TaxID=1802590 RepID=A0A1F4U6F7_UNCW3|nr:MAG: hypothetical protein A2Y85_01380 [candidate division WOR-3 bacterium RBG_13_43_14]